MPERWNTEECRVHLDAATIRSASRTLHRLEIKPVAREPGRSGMNLYDADEVRTKAAARPRAVARTVSKGDSDNDR